MESPNPSAVRVLTRPHPSSSSSTVSTSTTQATGSASIHPPHPPSNPSASSSSAPVLPEGVVVVGFLANRRGDGVTHLINRILDANVFGSGNLDKDFLVSHSKFGVEQEEWFRSRRISYCHCEEKGIVYLQFSPSSTPSPWFLAPSGSISGKSCLDYYLEESESNDFRGMLFMFSVCHVIIFLHEGLCFDTHILKKLRMLQGAKHALSPFIRSHVAPTMAPKASLPISRPIAQTTYSRSSGRVGSSRHGSAISLMSGSGSRPSLFPGQCIPIILFVFHDEFLDASSTLPTVTDFADASLVNESSSLAGTSKSNLSSKGSISVVMLARPLSKSEGSFKKKIQSSLEAQIRFLIKKCRIPAGSESGNSGLRGVSNVSSLPLFSIDASRAVVLLDRSKNLVGESLNFVTGLLEEIVSSKVASDIFSIENQCQDSHNEDVQCIKDFICRQSDTLRGKGALPTNANSASAAGVGMVAAAAAAAAASAAAGKPISIPELPSLENWLSSCKIVLGALFSVNSGPVDEKDPIKSMSLQRIVTLRLDEAAPQETSTAEAAVSWLETSKGLNLKFSTTWCQRALPAAKEIYLKDLPASYPTSVHKTQLEKALHAFRLMVKGPAVQLFAKRLEDECTLIWKSGRQLCDSISLTGKPCMHQRHHVESDSLPLEADFKPHSSGFVFLHACACGRSRRLRDDPFDFSSANITFNCFPNCENLLPSLIFPKESTFGSLISSSWSLVRLGGATYYNPSNGLLQSGFCSSEKFLVKWTMTPVEKETNGVMHEGAIEGSTADPSFGSFVNQELREPYVVSIHGEVRNEGLKNQRKSSNIKSFKESNVSFGKDTPSFVMKKAFSEVVAGTASVGSTFSLHQQRKQQEVVEGKSVQQMGASTRAKDEFQLENECGKSQKVEQISVQRTSHNLEPNYRMTGDPFLQIGSNVVPVNMNVVTKVRAKSSLATGVVYVGFEHECSYGHRYLLSSEHLNVLGSSYTLPSESISSSKEDTDGKYAEKLYEENLNKNILSEKVDLNSSGANAVSINNVRRTYGSSETTCSQQRVGREQNQSSSMQDHEGNIQNFRMADGGPAIPLLNRNLPIYMNCPHCKKSKKKDKLKIKFASTIAQLQRIFVVTPPFPFVLATCPVIEFADSFLPPHVPDRDQQSRFSIGCRVILPPESFLTLRLPFVYGVHLDDGSLHPLNHNDCQPELTAWLVKGTALQVVSKGDSD